MSGESGDEKVGRHRRSDAEEKAATSTPGFEPRHGGAGRSRRTVSLVGAVAAALAVVGTVAGITVLPALSGRGPAPEAFPSTTPSASQTSAATPSPTTSVTRTIPHAPTSTGPTPLTSQQLDQLCAGQILASEQSGQVEVRLDTSDARCAGRPAAAIHARYQVDAGHTTYVTPAVESYDVTSVDPPVLIGIDGVAPCGLEVVFRGNAAVPNEIPVAQIVGGGYPAGQMWLDFATCP